MSCGKIAAVSRRLTTLLTVVVISITILGGQIAASQAGNRNVVADNLVFTPKNVTIRAGSSVTFKFVEPATAHDVTSIGSKRFRTISARTTGSVKRVFRRGGVYRYECTLHPGMEGRITVR